MLHSLLKLPFSFSETGKQSKPLEWQQSPGKSWRCLWGIICSLAKEIGKRARVKATLEPYFLIWRDKGVWEAMTACNSLGWPSGRGFICSEFNTQFRKKPLCSLKIQSAKQTSRRRENLSQPKIICWCGDSVNKCMYVYLFLHGHTHIYVNSSENYQRSLECAWLGCWALVG